MKAVSFLSKPIKRILAVTLSLGLLLAAVPAVLLPATAADNAVVGIDPGTELAAPVGTNLITNNPGFDSSSVSGFWNTGLTSTGVSGTTLNNNGVMKVTKRWTLGSGPNTLATNSDSIAVTGGTTYQFGISVYTADADAKATAYLVLKQNTGTTTYSTAVQGSTADWTKLSGIVTLDPTTTSVELQLYFKRFDDETNGDTWYADDVYLYKTTERLVTASDASVNTTFDANINTWALHQQHASSDVGIPTAAFRWENRFGRTAAGSLYLGKDSPNSPVLLDSSVKMAVEAGQSYTWGMWYTSHDSNTTARLDVVLYDAAGNEMGKLNGREFMLSRADTLHDWKLAATTVAMPAGTAYASYRLFVDSGRAQLFVDDIFTEKSDNSIVYGTVTAGQSLSVNHLMPGYTYSATIGGALAFTDLNGKPLTGLNVLAGQNFAVPSTAVSIAFAPAASGLLTFKQVATPVQEDNGWTSQVAWYPENEVNSGTPKLTFFRLAFTTTKPVAKAYAQLAAPNNAKGFYFDYAGGYTLHSTDRTGENAGKALPSRWVDLTQQVTIGTGSHLLATAAYHSGDLHAAGMAVQIDVLYTDGTTERFGTGLANTTTTVSSMTLAAGENPDVVVGNRESSGWWKPVDQSGWSWVPAQLRGVPPISGGIGSLAYNWDVDLVTDRPSVKLESIPTISATAGETAVGLIPFTERSGSMDQSIRVRLFKDGAYYATTTLTAAADATGASAGSGLLKVSVNTPDYLPSGTYAVKPYACDVALKNGDTLLNLTLTACNKTAGVGQLDQVTVEGANKDTVESTVDVMINGGFENGNNNWSLTSAGATVVGSSFAQDGEGYGVLDRRTSTATAQLYCNQFAVQPNTEYTLSFWKYSEVATQTYYTVHYCNSSNGIISSKNGGTGYVATDGWQQITTTFTTSAETAYLRIDLSHNAGASQSVSYVDNVSVRATADPTVNLLPNGSFESGMSGWSSGGSAPASVASSPATHSGNGMLKLDRSSGTDAGVNSYLLDVEANKTYTVTYWHRIVGQAQSYVYIYLKGASGYSGLGAKNVISVTNGWEQKSFTFTTKADTTQVRVDFNCNAYTGVAYIDDVTLTTTVNESVSTTADKTVLTVNGKPYSPILYLRTFGKNSLYYDRDLLSVFAESDVRLYSTYGGMLGNVTTTGATPVWNEDGSINYAALDEDVYEILDINPNALVLFNIDMDAPPWWMNANPNECIKDAGGNPVAVSWASAKYRTEASAVLQQIVDYLYNEAPYRHRLFGIRFSGGRTYEWMTDQNLDGAFDDTAAMVAALNAELGGTSYTADQIKTAVTTAANVTLIDTASIAYAYNRLLSQVISDSILAYSGIVKSVSGNNWLAGAYNGYLWNFTSSEGIGAAHTTVDSLLESDAIDFIASPVTYGERIAGHYPSGMSLSESIAAHGKLYFLEQDNRTVSAKAANGEANSVGKEYSVKDTVDQLTRDMAVDMVKNNGFWMLDMEGGWFSDAAVVERIKQFKTEYDYSLSLDTQTNSEIAVIIGDDTYDYFADDQLAGNASKSHYLLTTLYKQQRVELGKLGAAYDTYALSDIGNNLSDAKLASYKLFVVLSPFGMTVEQANAIKATGATVLWVYLPGGASNVSAITDHTVSVGTQLSVLSATYEDYGFGTTSYATGPKATVSGGTPLATYPDSSAAVSSKTVTGTYNYTSVYAAVPGVPAPLLRKLADEAGVHRYTDNKDAIVETNGSYLSITALHAGETTVTLPESKFVYNVLTGASYGNTASLTLTLGENETALLRVTAEQSGAPIATPSDHGGDTELPAGAVNLLSGGDFSAATAAGWSKSGNFATAATVADGMLRYNDATSSAYLVFNRVQIIPGATYTYSLYYWVTDIANTQVDIRARVLTGDDKQLYLKENWITKVSNGWNRLSFTFTVPTDYQATTNSTSSEMRVWLYNAAAPNSAYPGTIYYDDVSLICEQHYIGIDYADPNDTIGNVDYNGNSGANRTYIEFLNDLTLPVSDWGTYQGSTALSIDGASITGYAAGLNNPLKFQVYTANGSGDFRGASEMVVPAGTTFTKGDTTVYFVRDFVLEKTGAGWVKKEQITDHTADGGRYTPDGFTTADDIFVGAGELTTGAGGFTVGDGGSKPTGAAPTFADGIVSAEGVTAQVANANYWFIKTPTITVEAGATYQLSYYIWVTDATNLQYDMYVDSTIAPVKAYLDFALNRAGKTNVKIGQNYYDLTASSANSAAITAKTGGWQLVTYTWEAAQSGTGSFYFKNYGAGPSTYHIDDIALYKVKDATVEFKGATATLSERIHLNFHIASPKVFAINDELTMKFTYTGRNGEVTEWVSADPNKAENGNYVFSLTSLVAAYMATEITAEVGIGTADAFVVQDSMTYSIREYGKAILDGNYQQKDKDAAAMLLNYGAWAQSYFGYNEGNPANTVVPNAQKVSDTGEWLAQIESIDQYRATVSGKLDSFMGYTLLLKDGTAMRIYFKEQVTATVDGVAAPAVKDTDSDRWYIEIAGVGAGNLDTAHTVVVNGSMTISNLSVLSPARTVAKSSSHSENFRNLCISLILYAQRVNQL